MRKSAAFILLLTAPLLGACGKKGPLVYPELLVPSAPADLLLRQSGAAMKLSLQLPQKDLAGRPLKDLSGLKVLRRETPAYHNGGGSCSSCTSEYVLFRKLYLDLPDTSVQRHDGTMVLMDSDVSVGSEYGYVLVPFNAGGLDGQASAPITGIMAPPPAPPTLKASPAPTEIRLKIASRPTAKGQGTLIGYNVYRTKKGEQPSYLPHSKQIVANGTYVDSGLERRVTYSYVARSVVRLDDGRLIESGGSNEVNVQLLDEDE